MEKADYGWRYVPHQALTLIELLIRKAGDGPKKPRRLHDHPNLMAWGRRIGARYVVVPLQLTEPLFELGFFRSNFLIEFKSHCFMKFP
jgi:hypothetical protein